METQAAESTDGSSIVSRFSNNSSSTNTKISVQKPVSSLRSHFENLTTSIHHRSTSSSRDSSPKTRLQVDEKGNDPTSVGRASVDLPRPEKYGAFSERLSTGTSHTVFLSSATPLKSVPLASQGLQQRPSPADPPLPQRHISPSFLIGSPPAQADQSINAHRLVPLPIQGSSAPFKSSRDSPIQVPRSANQSPATPLNRSLSPFLPKTEYEAHPDDSTAQPAKQKEGSIKRPNLPPLVNRSYKPSTATRSKQQDTLAPHQSKVVEKVSPFSTPPSSDESQADTFQQNDDPIDQSRSQHAKARNPPAQSSLSMKRAPPAPPPYKTHKPDPSRNSLYPETGPNELPELPPRHNPGNVSLRQSRSASPLRRTRDPERLKSSGNTTKILPLPKRELPHNTKATDPSNALALVPALDSPRTFNGLGSANYGANPLAISTPHESDQRTISGPLNYLEYPESTLANRRKPLYKRKPHQLGTGCETKVLAVGGEHVCTAGHFTRVWSWRTGELVMELTPEMGPRYTSAAFKAVEKLSDESSLLWLGTVFGDIHELDLSAQKITAKKPGAHKQREIIRLYRYSGQMWSLDDDGKLLVWAAYDGDNSYLKRGPVTHRIPRGHTFSLIAGGQLWYATGKLISIFDPSSSSNAFQVLEKPISYPDAGDVTSGTTLGSDPRIIYFGHSDGKVTIYSRDQYKCIGVVSLSLYMINALASVGDNLWAGYNTGMIYVYDTKPTPWIVRKDWRAHENPVTNIVVDTLSIWMLDRLQVISLGNDEVLRVWDGILQDDWLDMDMHNHDFDYCSFREVQALVMTWNAGASRPKSLRQNENDSAAFRDILQRHDPPELLVFGFQELVDLEDTTATAKSFFRSKKKDSTEQDQMKRQYLEWREFLTRTVEECLPAGQGYENLHTASLVGLFTCVFVKSSERRRINNLAASEVKRGMGGRTGNKGALILRFDFDDSSICLINCHLAAGQRETVHRNNDIAAILETPAFSASQGSDFLADRFVGGGDGSMVLDHEICILNGDLNYRIDAIPRENVVNAVKANNLTKLLERDQLLLARKRNPGFRLRAFNELPITFAPTYKYDVGTDIYDSSEKRRSPAWCDRLLYRGLGRIRQLSYGRHEIRLSDHRPVTGMFLIRIKTVIPEKREKARDDSEVRAGQEMRRAFENAKYAFLVNTWGLEERNARQEAGRGIE